MLGKGSFLNKCLYGSDLFRTLAAEFKNDKIMNTIFKNVWMDTVGDSRRVYDFKKQLEESGVLEKIHCLFPEMNLFSIQKMWTSMLFKLPIMVVGVNSFDSTDCVIFDNLQDIDSLMRIIGAYEKNELYLDPESFELALESNNGQYIPLEEIYDTYKLLTLIENNKQTQLYSKETIECLQRINSNMQAFVVTERIIQVEPKYQQDVINLLSRFYHKYKK